MKSAFMFLYIWLQTKIQDQIQKEDITDDRGTWYQERPTVGHNRPERQN